MRLQRLTLKNFKGARSFVLEPNGGNTNVYADNGVGKTTLFDAFTWVLFGKDSLGSANFDIKTLDEAGNAASKLDHEVEMVLDLGDDEVTLRKVYAEDWKKKRGSASESFSGHKTDYFIDGVPVQQKEYNTKVAEIAPEDVFRLLTDPAAFNKLHWQKRRELLLEVCGDVSDADVIVSNPELKELPEILGKRSLENHKKVIEARRREINDELKTLPARVDEVNRSLPELPGREPSKILFELGQLREQRQELERERARIQAGGELAEKRRRLSEIQGELKDIENNARGAIDAKVQEAKHKRGAIDDKHDAKVREVRRLEGELEDVQARIAALDKQLGELRAEWKTIDGRAFERSHDENCPVCKQPLPPEQVKDAHDKALEEFNARQSRDLEANKAAGKAKAAEKSKLESQVEDLRAAIAEGRDEVEKLALESNKANADIERLQKAMPDVSKRSDYQQLAEEQGRIEAAIEDLRSGNSESLTEVASTINELDEKMIKLQEDAAKFDQRAELEERIEQLEEREKELAAEYEELDRQLFLCETFIRSKVDLLTDRINSKFELTQFKLFETQINEGLKETCEAMHKGVPFGSLNHGGRIQVGLDIVRTLQAHYGLFPPVWVDGKESVTKLPEMSCQLICLVVTPGEKQLRVETAPKREEVAA